MHAKYKENRRAHKKRDHNELLAKLCLDHCKAPARALAYDGPLMETSTCWAARLGHGCSRRARIKVVERNAQQAAKMACSAPPGTRVIASTANRFLRGMKCGMKFNLVYMDCMGSVTGNRACGDFP